MRKIYDGMEYCSVWFSGCFLCTLLITVVLRLSNKKADPMTPILEFLFCLKCFKICYVHTKNNLQITWRNLNFHQKFYRKLEKIFKFRFSFQLSINFLKISAERANCLKCNEKWEVVSKYTSTYNIAYSSLILINGYNNR